MEAIKSKIIGYKVLSTDIKEDGHYEPIQVITEEQKAHPEISSITVEPIFQDTVLQRPELLFGSTYKLKFPQVPNLPEHAIFLTFNHTYILGKAVPFELFFNTKNKELVAWLETISLTLTTLFRTGTDITHLLEEYRTIQASTGGYRGKLKKWEEKPKYYTSILGEIADVIEYFLRQLEELNKEDLTAEGRVERLSTSVLAEEPVYPPHAILCTKCQTKAAVLLDGCYTCLNCGDSKCN